MITTYDKITGRITGLTSCADDMLEYQGIFDGYIEGHHDHTKYYINVIDESLIQLPIKPEGCHTFNWETHQWEMDITSTLLFVKAMRGRLLQETDWTDTVSAQTRLSNYNEWQSYRQALRDITLQPEYPFDIVWPTKPE